MDDIALLRQSSRRAVRELGMLQDSWASSGCTTSQCHALIELGAAGFMTRSELAEVLGLDRSTLSRTLAPLVESGLVVEMSDESDGRLKPLTLTPAGRARLESIDGKADGQVSAALALLDSSQRVKVVEGMRLYASALERARLTADLRIRPLEPGDNPEVARIIRDVMGEYGAVGEGYSIRDSEIEDMYSAYANDRSAFFVIERSRKVLGCGGIGPLVGAPEDVCELRKMYFRPEIRGLGMGRRLLDHCLQAARGLGYRICYLETLSWMKEAQRLYTKAGFRRRESPRGETGHFSCDAFFEMAL